MSFLIYLFLACDRLAPAKLSSAALSPARTQKNTSNSSLTQSGGTEKKIDHFGKVTLPEANCESLKSNFYHAF